MTDIVERLRLLAAIDNCQASIEAAAEIERLRAAARHIDGLQNHLWLDALAGRGINADVVASTSGISDWSFVSSAEETAIGRFPLPGELDVTGLDISEETMAELFHVDAASWLAEPNVVAVGGSWLCPPADIRSGNWAGITAMCERAMKSLKAAPR